MANYLPHTVSSGESLSSVAKAYGLPNYKHIYNHPKNQEFRQIRANPNQIQPGDKLFIPPSPIQLIEQQIALFEKLSKEHSQLIDELIAKQNEQLSNLNKYTDNLDVIASVATMFVSLGFKIADGYKALKLTGKELAKANSNLAISAFKDSAQRIIEHTPLNSIPESEDAVILSLTKKGVKFFFDIQTPSFWTGVITGTDPNQVNREVIGMLNEQKLEAIKNMDQKILEKRKQLMELRSQYGFEPQL